jgi:hypothetical protein
MVYGKPFYSSDPPLEWSSRIHTARLCGVGGALARERCVRGCRLRACWRFSRAAPSRALVQGRASPAAASATPPCRSMERAAGFGKPTSRVMAMVVSSVLCLCLLLLKTSIYLNSSACIPFFNCYHANESETAREGSKPADMHPVVAAMLKIRGLSS